MSLVDLGTYAFIGASIGMVILTVSFFLFSEFYESFVGWLIASFMFSTSGIMSMATFRILTGMDSQVFYIVRLCVFLLFALAIWVSAGTYLYVQLVAKDKRE